MLSQISNCQGLGRKNKHDILKTDRRTTLAIVVLTLIIVVITLVIVCDSSDDINAHSNNNSNTSIGRGDDMVGSPHRDQSPCT